jgi:predicted enzyme related to lactoylglutathione lyase
MKLLINIDVPDLYAGIDFYCAALPLTLGRILDQDVAELVGAQSVLYLLQKRASTAPVKGVVHERDYRRHWTPVHLDFVVDDLDVAAKRALRAGAVREGDCIEWRGSRCISFGDPFGHGFCLIELTGSAYLGDPQVLPAP